MAAGSRVRLRRLMVLMFGSILLLLWLWRSQRAQLPIDAAFQHGAPPAASVDVGELREFPESERSERVDAAPAEAAALPSASTDPAGATLVGFLVDAEHGAGLKSPVSIVLSRDQERRCFEAASLETVFRAETLSTGAWCVEIQAEGYLPLRTTTEINATSGLVSERYVMWPENWVRVRVITTDGRPYSDLARELGFDSGQVFEEGFRVWRAPSLPEAAAQWPATLAVPGRADAWISSSTHHRSEEPRTVAVVRRFPVGSTWVAVAFHSHFLGWQEAPPGADAVAFEMTLDKLEAQLGALRGRVVDPISRAAIVDARARLVCAVGQRNRADTVNPPIDPLSGFSVQSLLPGEYDLTISAPDRAERSQHIVIEPGRELDLGDLELDVAPPLEIRVFDQQGKPVRAQIQFGEWRPGASVWDCVTNDAVYTDDAGVLRRSTPASKVVARISAQKPNSGDNPQYDTFAPAYILLEPSPSAQHVEVAIPSYFDCELELPPGIPDEVTVHIVNSLELIVATGPYVELPAGVFRALLLDGEAKQLGTHEFTVPRDGPTSPIVLR